MFIIFCVFCICFKRVSEQAVLSCKSKLFEAIDQYSFSVNHFLSFLLSLLPPPSHFILFLLQQSLYGGEEGELICSLVRNLASTIDEDHLASNPFQFTRISECLSRILNLKCWQFCDFLFYFFLFIF